MHTIYIGKRKFKCASKWGELSGNQLIAIADVLHTNLIKSEALIRILLVLMEVKSNLWLRWMLMFRIGADAKYDLLSAADWVLDTENDCTLQKLPVIKSRGTWGHNLYGPLKDCRRFVFMEFIEADTAYLDFRKHFEDKTKRENALNRLMAILYRDKNPDSPYDGLLPSFTHNKLNHWNGDHRVAFNPNILEYRIKQVAKIPIRYKYAVLMFFHACHKKWEENHPDIFKKADTDSENESSGGWANALMSLGGGSLHIDKMMQVNAAAALRDLNDKIVENARQQEEIDKIKNR